MIMIIIIFITFLQAIYKYIIETNRVSRIHSVAAVLYLQFVLHVMLFRPWNMLCTFTLALSVVRVQCPIWLFSVVPLFRALPVCCSGIVWMILRWFQLFRTSRLLLGSTCSEFLLWGLYILEYSLLLLFYHMSISWYCKSINRHAPFQLQRITMSDVLLGIVLSDCSSWFHVIVTAPSRPVSTNFGTWYTSVLLLLLLFTFARRVRITAKSAYHLCQICPSACVSSAATWRICV